jgi:hypothetical protein
MGQKYQAIFHQILKFAQAEPYIVASIGLVLLILLLKNTKQMLFLLVLGFICLSVWLWFSSSAESKNKNKKFQRYKSERLEKQAEPD